MRPRQRCAPRPLRHQSPLRPADCSHIAVHLHRWGYCASAHPAIAPAPILYYSAGRRRLTGRGNQGHRSCTNSLLQRRAPPADGSRQSMLRNGRPKLPNSLLSYIYSPSPVDYWAVGRRPLKPEQWRAPPNHGKLLLRTGGACELEGEVVRIETFKGMWDSKIEQREERVAISALCRRHWHR